MTDTFGYLKAWAKKSLATLLDEYQLDDEIILSGKVKVKDTQATALIAYLSDPTNCGQYGYELDFALFYKDTDSVKIGGTLTTPYKKEGTTFNANTTTTTRAKRTL